MRRAAARRSRSRTSSRSRVRWCSGRAESKRRTASKSLCVKVLDDAHDEGVEQMTLVLSNPVRAYLIDGTGTGSISNSDPMPEAWLARFGRTAATHVTDAVGERLRASPGQESQVTVGGYRLPLEKRASGGAEPETTTGRLASLLTGLAGMAGLGLPQPAGVAGTDPRVDRPESDPRLGRSQTLTLQLPRLRDVLLGSSFRLNLGDDAGPGHMRLTAWGRVAGTRFDGRDGDLSLDGDVLTGTVGVDGEWDRLLAGVAVAHSRGQGGYTMPDMDARGEGDLETALTSIHPYLRYAVTERLDVWGLLGYGWGDLTLEPGADATFETDTTFIMGAFGSRGILLQASDSGGFELATRTDAMLTRTSSDAVTTGDGNLASSEADAHRVRLVLEGSRGFTWPEGRTLTPTLEIGLRHDWGDAETGFGLELGGRVQYADPTLGLTIEGDGPRPARARRQRLSGMGRERLPPHRSGPGRPGPLPDPRPNLGRGLERDGWPVVAADHRRPGPPRRPPVPDSPTERRNRLWHPRAFRPRTPDPLCRHRPLGRRGPHLPPRHPLDRRLGPVPLPGRPTPGTGGPTAGQPGPPTPGRLGLLKVPLLCRPSSFCHPRPDRGSRVVVVSSRRGRISCGPPSVSSSSPLL